MEQVRGSEGLVSEGAGEPQRACWSQELETEPLAVGGASEAAPARLGKPTAREPHGRPAAGPLHVLQFKEAALFITAQSGNDRNVRLQEHQ